MKITIHNTDRLVKVNEVPARIWEGKTDTGIPIICFITRIAVGENESVQVLQRFKDELMHCEPPSEEAKMFSLRMVISLALIMLCATLCSGQEFSFNQDSLARVYQKAAVKEQRQKVRREKFERAKRFFGNNVGTALAIYYVVPRYRPAGYLIKHR